MHYFILTVGSVTLFIGLLRAAGHLQRTIIYNCSMRVRVCFAGYLCVRVCVCVPLYVCMLQVFYGTVCWRSAPHRGQACLLPCSTAVCPYRSWVFAPVKIKPSQTPVKSGQVVTLMMLLPQLHGSPSQQTLAKTPCVYSAWKHYVKVFFLI